MIKSIQFLRAVAALMVVYFHVTATMVLSVGYQGTQARAGSAGVDVFFVISGFVIFLISSRRTPNPIDFFVRRIIRIGPTYWLYTSIIVVPLILAPSLFHQMKFDPVFIVSSYLFLLANNVAGIPATILGQGWTLTYEMYFYGVFAVGMAILPKAPFRFLAPVILAGTIASFWLHDIPAFAHVALSALPLEFLAGCLLAQAYQAKKFLPKAISWPAIGAAIAALYCRGFLNVHPSGSSFERFLYFGIPSAVLVYSIVSLDMKGSLKFPKFALFVGDSSYSLYLCHSYVLLALGKVWLWAGLKILPSCVFLLVGIAASISVGAISYLFFEKPVTRWLTSAWSGIAAHI